MKCYSAEKNGQYRNYLILHHDNVPCHTPLQCSSFWRYKSLAITQTPYTPDPTGCDFWVFLRLKIVLKGHCFMSVREIQEVFAVMARVLEQVCLCMRAVFWWLLGKVLYTLVFTTNYVWVPETLWSSYIHVITSAHLLVIMMIISLMGREWYSFGKYNVITVYNKLTLSPLI